MGVWRDISLLWLIFLTLLAIMPIGVLFFYAIKAMHRLRQIAKRYFPIAQEKTRQLADMTDKISLRVARPFIRMHTQAAQVTGVTKAVFARRKNS